MKDKLSFVLFLYFFLFQPLLLPQRLHGQDVPDVFGRELIVYQDSQILYNGKIWRRPYYNIMGDEFLFTSLWLRGDVTVGNQAFTNRMFRYDIMNDELLIRRPDRVVLVLNKEMVRGFGLIHEGVRYRFDNYGNESGNDLKGYARVLYDGRCKLLMKYVKEINPLGYQKLYDIFVQSEQVFLVRDGKSVRLRGRRGLLAFLEDQRDELKKFIRTNNVVILPRQPESVIPVLDYYNTLHNLSSGL